MKKFFVTVIFLFFVSKVLAQGTSGTDANYEYRYLIDVPSTGVMEKGFVGVSLDAMPLGVIITKIEVGVFKNFSFGISYGGANVIGQGTIDWYKLPGVNVRFRVLDESDQYPAITIGFDSQGKGVYYSSNNRFEIKSPGFFASTSRNFKFLGYLNLVASLNYSLERKDGDKDLNFAFGLEKTIGNQISVIAEYNLGINDNNGGAYGNGSGYLNIGARFSPGGGFTFGMDLRNLSDNRKINGGKADRAIFVEYIKAIF
jgi:hypothetical protein